MPLQSGHHLPVIASCLDNFLAELCLESVTFVIHPAVDIILILLFRHSKTSGVLLRRAQMLHFLPTQSHLVSLVVWPQVVTHCGLWITQTQVWVETLLLCSFVTLGRLRYHCVFVPVLYSGENSITCSLGLFWGLNGKNMWKALCQSREYRPFSRSVSYSS